MAKASEIKPVKKTTKPAPKATAKETKTVKKEQKRSENFKNGQWELKYLQFVNSFILQSGMSMGEAAEKAGITRQTIYHWFDLDDAKISSVIKFIKGCGYKVEFSLKPANDKVGDALVTINAKSFQETVGDKCLSFLDEALDRYGIQRKEAAERLGLGYTALYYWFKHDDVFISYIYKIAEQNGLKLVIKIDPE